MKRNHALLLALTILSVNHRVLAQGTAFTYQGQLQNNGALASGNYDFTFALYNSNNTNSGQVGATLTNLDVGVTNGLFVVTLDFGASFPGSSRWLAIETRPSGGTAFTPLNPLQLLTPTPYAIYAPNAGVAASASSVASTNISGMLSPNQLPTGIVTNTENNVTLGGTFSGAGTGLTSLSSSSLTGALPSISGANLTSLNASQLVTGSIPTRVLPGFQSASNYNTIGGGQNNTNNGTTGATIAGGANNIIVSGSTANQATIGGGWGSTNNGNYATVAGGFENYVLGTAATAAGYQNQATNAGAVVSGGGNNTAGGFNSVIAGGSANTNTGSYAAIGGGNLNLVTNSYATVAGGFSNFAGGQYSFAAGQQARATNNGSFVWADSQNAPFSSTNTNQFSVRANGGVVFSTGGAGVSVDGTSVLTAAPGAIQNYEINDGGAAAYGTFQQAVQAAGGDTSVTFSNLFPVSTTNGVNPALTLSLNGSAFGTVIGFSGYEGMSQPYSYVVEVSTTSASVTPASDVGATASLAYARNGRTTTFGGIVTGCTLAGSSGSTFLYTVQIESPLAYLALNTGYQIYENTTDPNIAQGVYQGDYSATVTQNLSSSYTLRNYTQYAESDLNFFNRILENEGIFYFFNQAASPPSLILGDSTAAYLSSPNSPFIYYGNTASNIPSGTECVRTFQNAVYQSTLKSVVAAIGLTGSTSTGAAGVGTYTEFGNSVDTTAYDQHLANVREGIQTAARANIAGTSTAPDLRAGYTFSLTDQSGAGLGGTYVVTGVHHSGFIRVTNGVSTLFYGNEFTAIPAATVYRSPLKTPKPQAQPCTGTVVAPSGEDVYVDEFGRVRVLFDWDQLDQNKSTYYESAAWLQVSSPWAHSAYGMMFLPRVGDEVLVSFLGGDPDEPVVTGSLYSAANVVPYTLPDNKYTSTIKTQSSSGTGFNELKFDDTSGSELYFMHAQKDMEIQVENNLTQMVDNDMTLNVTDDLTLTAGNQMTLNGPLTASGATSITGALTLSGGVLVNSPETNASTETLQGNTTVTGGLTVNNNPLTVNSSANMNGPLYVNGTMIANAFQLNTSAGTLTFENDSGVVPGIIANGGLASGHMRLRNGVEVWPNTAGTTSGYLDVRGTNGNAITVSLNGANGAIICSNLTASGVFYSSDRNVKHNITPLDPEATLAKVLAMPVTEWSYKADPAGTRHIGPMAQDFHEAFDLNGADDKHISIVDEGGVALAAIQGLNQKLQEKDAEIETLKAKAAKVDALEQRLNDLEAALKTVAEKSETGRGR